MAIKILIERKIRSGEEKEFIKAVKELRAMAIHAQGYISGETLCSTEDPSIHLVISTWRGIEDWNRWADSPERKAFQKKIDTILEVPTKVSSYQHEAIAPSTDEILAGLEVSVQDE